MARVDGLLAAALKQLPAKPGDTDSQSDKKRYSELMSQRIAVAIADELKRRGLRQARPMSLAEAGESGAERRMAGGLGAKKVDVTWSTEQSGEPGLLLAISVKTINFKDSRTQDYQKNLINRRGDMLMEAVTLHRRFPYAVLGGLFFLDRGAERDGTDKRRSTFLNAHARLQLFNGRSDPAGREEQFERFYLLLVDASAAGSMVEAFLVGVPEIPVPLGAVLDDLLQLVAQRSPDFYDFKDGALVRAG